ncbi:phage tail protein [Vibrio sp. D173a]|uniref:phage tail protein n=1 Tax=Vibrio sp. D173a TaxID=2836349 RepID=UPI0025553802|nr:phage tail protein [Vibrio sp. D173a]MDK9756731.1 phage tail protein [Vibrio sp. D173a]
MGGPSFSRSNTLLDTKFIRRYEAFEKELPKVMLRAAALTSRWLRGVSMTELGYELSIDNKALRSRFRVYKNGKSSKLWIGVRDIGVHRMGKPVQNRLGVQVGEHFFAGAFISPMNSDELLVWRRRGKSRSSIEKVELNIADDVDAIIENYLPDINRKFEAFFHREFKQVLSLAA